MTEQNQQNDEYENLNKLCQLYDIDLQYLIDGFQKISEMICEFATQFAKSLESVFEGIEFDEASVLSEKEIKKKIKYAKTPMEVKHWNKILNEKKRRKRNEEN